MSSIFARFRDAQLSGSGAALADVFTALDSPPELHSFYSFTNALNVVSDVRYALLDDRVTSIKFTKTEASLWVDIFVAFWKIAAELVKFESDPRSAPWGRIFILWKEIANLVIKGYSNCGLQAWTLPCLYTTGKYLRRHAIKADTENETNPDAPGGSFEEDVMSDVHKNKNLEEASRVINRMFTLCLHDRAPIEESRKWGVYHTVNLSFKTYFKLGTISSCKSLLHAMEASQADMPPLTAFPKSHIVTFKYYLGVIHFLEESYPEAEEHLTYAWNLCHTEAVKNRELILTYLIPCHLVTAQTLPSKTLLAPFPRLEALFRPLCDCILKGDLAGFDAAIAAGGSAFTKRMIYLPLERGRDMAVRNLFRRVFLAGGFDPPISGLPPIRRTRVPVKEFVAAIRIKMSPAVPPPQSGDKQNGEEHEDKLTPNKLRAEIDQVECYLSNLIYKNFMKGYIARERGIIVLSKGGVAFPGTGV
ncbi:COP9 signalosome (CSN) subunit [Ophidiomyces ophidiicola]|uniref:COP9 signalosome (CSN) subunit n=1 Tax=Ophidiomyces ophidiicola TaxID=1387563 RepID=A0ACB8UNT0_9EURO|nr:COP9 signalosome (CSN) subunit [Ophidiomyces ophidiicola]KAI1912895.1 COP9 signalosome (CSN) subunit [Ophidiomyces ophidiicola]KAI1930766.1 COP9 signalosome (CSN) subunit [Ophidiomyces ophidiicola]KAI1942923.1 COP9 signalosome (CSN) subunit [Ophidiomyces ophidiicola]KAI1962223.1 COP9 signalosome (CSN) subunit [Ophidiomyces ophidiicola]KAI1976116.1 COP9 signalosome (CSN) subunit [Ophidiomyces ophidiicola]